MEPQIVIGLLVNQDGFPLGLQSFEGKTAETKTIIPVIEEFRSQHHLDSLTVVADAGMLSLKNLEALSQAGYNYVVGSRLFLKFLTILRVKYPVFQEHFLSIFVYTDTVTFLSLV